MANDLTRGGHWFRRIRRAAHRPFTRDLSIALLIKCLLLAALYHALAVRSEGSGRRPSNADVARALLGHPESQGETRHDR